MRLSWIAVWASWVGCRSESDIRFDPPSYGLPNPPPVEVPLHTDTIVQVTVPRVDVLFVVDNSCSMDEEQLALGLNFPAFLSWFLGSGLDYHIGVVSTDMKDPEHSGKLQERSGRRWIDSETDHPEVVFDDMVSLGIEGDYNESGRAAAYTAVEILAETHNLGFLREGAGLHITVVSDEDDASGDSPVSREEFVQYLLGARQSPRLVTFSSIVVPFTGCPDSDEAGADYMAVTNQVGGVIWPICSGDWTQVLDELGFLAVGLQREFFLSRLPVPGTVEVEVETSGVVRSLEEGVDWSYDERRNSVSFLELVPEPLAKIRLTYALLASELRSDETEDAG
ncbi:MAG TPA: hypothetical protein ENK18_08620 [Deltaproteobacteria bacterium]|nr:hypothetical protein [Deltaproteobacteria bacterium]